MRRARFIRWTLRRSGAAPERRPARIQSLRPQVAQAYKLLRAASRLGVPGALPAPPELLPAGARVLAQGYLNRFSLPLLRGWLLPTWMREQTDPTCDWFVPRSVANLMLNQTRRNWTALGLPGRSHPTESMVDSWGLLTPVPGGPSLDWWVTVDGGEQGRMTPSLRPNLLQAMQGGLPVVATSYEADGLRVASEVWFLDTPEGDWAAMQVVLFNIADLPLTGTFSFALRPYNPEGIAPIYDIAYDAQMGTLVAGGLPGPYTWPRPGAWALSGIAGGDLFASDAEQMEPSRATHLHDHRGFAHGTLDFRFAIEPWEEAEFLAFMPVSRQSTEGRHVAPRRSGYESPRAKEITPDPHYYARAKGAATLHWREMLGSKGRMQVELPHRALQSSWDANRAHLLALHDGNTITPGPDLYHSFWLRDGAYMIHALSACGFKEEAADLLLGLARTQRRDGAFVSHQGEWDGTGQALWCIAQHLEMHPDSALSGRLRPYVTRGAEWIVETLASSQGGLMPAGVSSEHLGPPDRYYWDSIWALAGLRAAQALTRKQIFGRAAARLRRRLAVAWATDMAALGSEAEALVAAPGRGLDLGMIGTLVAWFPLRLVPADSPLLEGTLRALEREFFFGGALLVNTGHSGWGTYLNMRLAGCRLLQGSTEGWRLMRWLLEHASPTYNWPEAIHPRSMGGSAGDGHHGWASAEWLLLVREVLLREEADGSLLLAPGFAAEWLERDGEVQVEDAPTRFGPLSYTLRWEAGGDLQVVRAQVEARAGRRKPPIRVRQPRSGQLEEMP